MATFFRSAATAVVFVAFGWAALQEPGRQAERPNQPISLNVTNVDTHDFLRFLHEATGISIVVAPDVRGRVTAHINDVLWQQALESNLRANDLVAEHDGNVLRVMTIEDARREYEDRRRFSEAAKAAAPLETCTYTLSNADARDVALVLRPFLSARGRIAVDTGTNTLNVRDVKSVLEELGFYPAPPSRGRCM